MEEERYEGNVKFGSIEGKLIAPVKETSGENRFYIMALEDINSGTRYSWYETAYGNGKLDKIVNGEENDFGVGEENTAYVIDKWLNSSWGEQSGDIWGAIQAEVSKGWFVPSKSEWAAFGSMVTEKLGVTTDNYTTYGLNSWYWSSSQYDQNTAYIAYFNLGYVDCAFVYGEYCVRLSAIF